MFYAVLGRLRRENETPQTRTRRLADARERSRSARESGFFFDC